MILFKFQNISRFLSAPIFPSRVKIRTFVIKRSFSGPVPKVRVLFLGSDDFSIGSLKTLKEHFVPDSLTVVVSHPNNSVAKFSKQHFLKVISWSELKEETAAANSEEFDLGVVASFGYLIPRNIIQRCRRGILNVHASLLPRWRGASPISHSIMSGDTVTGISIMQIAPHKFDVGPILFQKETPLHSHVRAPELKIILTETGSEALKEVLTNLDSYSARAKPQNNTEGTLAPKVSIEMSQVQWDSKNAIEIYNQYRGLYGFFKLRTQYQSRTVDLDDFAIYSPVPQGRRSQETILVDSINPSTDFSTFYEPPVMVKPYSLPTKNDIRPGDIYFSNNFLCVKCFGGNSENPLLNWIFIRKVKVGVKWMSAKDFRNGFLSKSEDRKFFHHNNDDSLCSDKKLTLND